MHVSLKPEDERFIAEQVKAGQFRSAEEAVSVALERLRYDVAPTADDLAATREGLDQLDRGEGVPWSQVRGRLVEKYGLDGEGRPR